MGITGLLNFASAAIEPSSIKKLEGKTVAVDAYWLLHKGSYCCSEKLVRGIKTTAMTDYAMKYVRMLQSYCQNIIMVFDGMSLPAKMDTNKKRQEKRENAKIKAIELSKSGKHLDAKKEFDKAVVITHEHALELMDECRRNQVDCIVSMYEADAQLSYLNKINLAEYIISEDSDLMLFGCKKIVYKLSLDGKCTIFDAEKLHLTIPKYTFENFRRICILSGCDYLSNLPGIGLFKAKKFIGMTAETDMRKAIPKIPSYLNLKITIPDDYVDNFLRAEATFKYMYVYDPLKKAMVRLNILESEEDEQYCINAGKLVSPSVAYQLALGNCDPKTLAVVNNYDPTTTSTSKKPSYNGKYKPLFSLWNFKGYDETAVKVMQQSKLMFVPMKFKTPIVAKIAEEENKLVDAFEINSIISAYCGTEVTRKRSFSTLNEDLSPTSQLKSSQPLKNPFAKRQSLGETEKADNCSLIKNLSSITKEPSIFEKTRVVSRFFHKNTLKKEKLDENPFAIIDRMEAVAHEKQILVEKSIDTTKKFYDSPKKVEKHSKVTRVVKQSSAQQKLSKFGFTKTLNIL